MIPSIVRQSIMIKCKIRKSKFLGNYEFFYAAGLFFKLSGADVPEHTDPKALKEAVTLAAESYEPKNEEEAYLIKCLLEMPVDEEKDAQIEELFSMGLSEEHFCQSKNPPYH